MLAAGPAARPPLTFLQLLSGPTDATFPGCILLGILDPADEFVASQGSDVLPSSERCRIADQRPRRSPGSLCTTPPGTRGPLTTGSFLRVRFGLVASHHDDRDDDRDDEAHLGDEADVRVIADQGQKCDDDNSNGQAITQADAEPAENRLSFRGYSS